MTNFSEAAAKENKGQSKELAEALAKAAAAKDKFAFVELALRYSGRSVLMMNSVLPLRRMPRSVSKMR